MKVFGFELDIEPAFDLCREYFWYILCFLVVGISAVVVYLVKGWLH